MNEVIAITSLALVVWYWWDGMRAKEAARLAGRKACESADLQFLDDTVARQEIRLTRNTEGRVSLYRQYTFEFTSMGDRRFRGSIAMTGRHVTDIHMDVHTI